MSGELIRLLEATDATGPPGAWRGYCLVHDDRRGNRSLDMDVKAKPIDIFEGTQYRRLYIHCRSCGANGTATAAVLGIPFSQLEDDAVRVELPRRFNRWRVPPIQDFKRWVAARRRDPDATRWLVEDRLLSVEFLDRYMVGWRSDRDWWIFPLLATSPCFSEPVPVGALWYPYRPLPDGRRKMCCWGGAPPALYPDVPAGRTVYLVEGELDAAVGRSHGLPTVSSTTGAGHWDDRLTMALRDKRVIVVYDCDDAGRQGARARVRDFAVWDIPARLHDLDPSRDDGFDLTDWFREGRTVSELRADVRRSRVPGPTSRAALRTPPPARDENGRRRDDR